MLTVFCFSQVIKLTADQALNHEDDNNDMMLFIWGKSAQLLFHVIPAAALNRMHFVQFLFFFWGEGVLGSQQGKE